MAQAQCNEWLQWFGEERTVLVRTNVEPPLQVLEVLQQHDDEAAAVPLLDLAAWGKAMTGRWTDIECRAWLDVCRLWLAENLKYLPFIQLGSAHLVNDRQGLI